MTSSHRARRRPNLSTFLSWSLTVSFCLWSATFQRPFVEGFGVVRARDGTALFAVGNEESVSGSETKARPSRSERKAAEREKKGWRGRKKNGRRHHNYAERNAQLRHVKDETPYDLHSAVLPRLTSESTADDVVRAVRRAQNYHDGHDLRNIERFLLEEVDAGFAYGYRGSLLARLAVAALHMDEHGIARKAIEVRRAEHRSSMLPLESAAVMRGLLRVHNVTDALAVLDDELSLPLEGTPADSPENREKIVHRCSAICSIVSRFFYENDPSLALDGCRMLRAMGPVVREAGVDAEEANVPWTRLLEAASACEAELRKSPDDDNDNDDDEFPVNMVYAVLDAMNTFPSDNDDRVYEILSNALVRRTCFVTGAVDLKSMPREDRGEAVFVGRSNVGKSSLVNMVTNRKSLAYTSKRPGKTQQFNFFAVNDKKGLDRQIRYGDDVPGEPDRDCFYIVDLPGFGFAKVPQDQRRRWAELTDEYLAARRSVRVIFHLVDARHGPIDDDVRIMTRMGEVLGDADDANANTNTNTNTHKHKAKYVVVLTKADKNVKDAGKKRGSGKVSKDVMKTLRETMRRCGVGKAPVILTSASTKLGRDDIWRYLKLAAEQ